MGSSQTAALRAVFELGCKDVKDEAAKAVSAGEITYTAPAPVRPKVKKPAAKRRK
jgi:hypothetical protein